MRLEIPFYIENAESLGTHRPVLMLVRLLELDAEDWPMHKLLGVLGNNYFFPAEVDWDGLAAGRAEVAIRSLQIPRGASDCWNAWRGKGMLRKSLVGLRSA